MVYMGSQKSSGDHFLGVVFNEESHGDLHFNPFCRPDTVMKLQSQTTRSTCPPPLGALDVVVGRESVQPAVVYRERERGVLFC